MEYAVDMDDYYDLLAADQEAWDAMVDSVLARIR